MANERPTEHLTEREAATLLATPDCRSLKGKRDHAILRVLLEGGLREGELCSLRVSDMKQYQGRVCLHFQSLKKRSGRKVLRLVPLSAETVGSIQAYWLHEYRSATPDPDAPAFRTLGERGPYPKAPLTARAVEGVVARAVAAAHIAKRITPHSLRHTCATFMLRGGADLATVRDHLGHAHIGTTARYLHGSFERQVEVVDALAALCVNVRTVSPALVGPADEKSIE